MEFKDRVSKTKEILNGSTLYNKHFLDNMVIQVESLCSSGDFELPSQIYQTIYIKLAKTIFDVVGYHDITNSVRHCLSCNNFTLARRLIDSGNSFKPIDFCYTTESLIFGFGMNVPYGYGCLMYIGNRHDNSKTTRNFRQTDSNDYEKMYEIIFGMDDSLIFRIVERSETDHISKQLLLYMYKNFQVMRSEVELMRCYENNLKEGVQILTSATSLACNEYQHSKYVVLSPENKSHLLNKVKGLINIENFLEYVSLYSILDVNTLFYHALRSKWRPKTDYVDVKDRMTKIFSSFPRFKSLSRPQNDDVPIYIKRFYMLNIGTFKDQFYEIFMDDLSLIKITNDKFGYVYYTVNNYVMRSKIDKRLDKFIDKYKVYIQLGLSNYLTDEILEEVMIDLEKALRKKPLTPFNKTKFLDFVDACSVKVNQRISELYKPVPGFPENISVKFDTLPGTLSVCMNVNVKRGQYNLHEPSIMLPIYTQSTHLPPPIESNN